MKITIQNYKQLRPSFDLSKLPKAAKEPFELIDNDFDDFLELYTDSDPAFNDIRKGLDNHIEIVNKYLIDAPKKPAPKVSLSSDLTKHKANFKKEGKTSFHLNDENQFSFENWLKKEGFKFADTSQTGNDILFYDTTKWNDNLTKKKTTPKKKQSSSVKKEEYIVTNGKLFLSNRSGKFILTDNIELAYQFTESEAKKQTKHAESLSKDKTNFYISTIPIFNHNKKQSSSNVKSHIIVSTKNGEGYSEPMVRGFSNKDDAGKFFFKELEDYNKAGFEISETKNNRTYLSDEEDDASIHHLVSGKEFNIIEIKPDTNQVKIIDSSDDYIALTKKLKKVINATKFDSDDLQDWNDDEQDRFGSHDEDSGSYIHYEIIGTIKSSSKTQKVYNYKGVKVAIRKKGKSYIIWDIKTDQKFANEKFKTKAAAKKFVSDNKMVLVDEKPKAKFKVGDNVKVKEKYLNEEPTFRHFNHGVVSRIAGDNNEFVNVIASQDKSENIFQVDELLKAKPLQKSKSKAKNQKPKQKESPCDDAIENYLEKKQEARAKASAKRKRVRVKEALDKENVNFYNAEFRLLRRFKNLVTKKGNTTFRSVQLLYMAFQKHSVARKVRKTSELANLYEICNKKLTKIYEAAAPKKQKANITFADKDVLEQLVKLTNNKKVDYAISLMNRVINVQGTAPEDAKVKRLISSIENAFKNGRVDERSRLYDDLVKAKKNLNKYLEDKVEKIPTENYGLSGVKKKKMQL